MPNLMLTLPRPNPGQQKIIDAAKRLNMLTCGRRFGKTALGIDRIICVDRRAYRLVRQTNHLQEYGR